MTNHFCCYPPSTSLTWFLEHYFHALQVLMIVDVIVFHLLFLLLVKLPLNLLLHDMNDLAIIGLPAIVTCLKLFLLRQVMHLLTSSSIKSCLIPPHLFLIF